MNTASQDLPKHLAILRDKLTHPTDYELAFTYFLEEFAADLGFHEQGVEDDAPHLRVVLGFIASKAMGRPVTLEDFRAAYLNGHGFFHGRAIGNGHVVIFFYFEQANVGLMALIQNPAQEHQVARFRLPEHAARNPKHN